MILERGMIIKFRDYINCNRKFRSKESEDKYLEKLRELEGKIATIYIVDFNNIDGEPSIEVNEFLGESFPISYFEYVVPTIPIEIPKEYLKDNNVVKLRNGEKLLYTDGLFLNEFCRFSYLDDFTYDLKYKRILTGEYDIDKIYENNKLEKIIWERGK